MNYNKPIPDGYEIAELPPCTYLYFNGMPFEDQNDFPIAIGILNEAIENYPFKRFGWGNLIMRHIWEWVQKWKQEHGQLFQCEWREK